MQKPPPIEFLEIEVDKAVYPDPKCKHMQECVHLFDQDSIDAVNTALAARRPLLLRGDPGMGKSQLARAVATVLKRRFVQHVVDGHCEPRDLLWHFDAVQRLADAQLGDSAKMNLAVENYVYPGPLWWAFDWTSAEEQAKQRKRAAPKQLHDWDESKGAVVLIDEIDKAEMDVPNGLLEALGDGRFTPMGWEQQVSASEPYPLVIITTNEERSLPNAFMRRCVVLHLDLFAEGKDSMAELSKRGKAHFPKLDDQVLIDGVTLLLEDRKTAREKHLPQPGQAEYLDLLRAVQELASQGRGTPAELMETASRFITKKGHG